MRRESIQHATKKSNMKAAVEKMGDKNGIRHRKQVAKWQKPFLISNYLKSKWIILQSRSRDWQDR